MPVLVEVRRHSVQASDHREAPTLHPGRHPFYVREPSLEHNRKPIKMYSMSVRFMHSDANRYDIPNDLYLVPPSQGQCHPHGNPGPDLRVILGQHEMTEEECRFVKTALISKALDRTSALLRLMVSRIEYVTLSRRGKQSWSHEGAEFLNLQQLVSSLIQSFGLLKKRLQQGSRGASRRQRADSHRESYDRFLLRRGFSQH